MLGEGPPVSVLVVKEFGCSSAWASITTRTLTGGPSPSISFARRSHEVNRERDPALSHPCAFTTRGCLRTPGSQLRHSICGERFQFRLGFTDRKSIDSNEKELCSFSHPQATEILKACEDCLVANP